MMLSTDEFLENQDRKLGSDHEDIEGHVKETHKKYIFSNVYQKCFNNRFIEQLR
jgi:hypothetical protein